MERFPSGAWVLPRPNLVSWTSKLDGAYPSKGVNRARDRMFALGRRLDAACRVAMTEDDDDDSPNEYGVPLDPPSSLSMPPPPVPKKNRKGKPAPPVDDGSLLDNNPAVCHSNSLLIVN
jgi:hypothetical protein